MPERRERDGGMPSGNERGSGTPTPETVDDGAVASLDVPRGELAGADVPRHRAGSGGMADGEAARDAGAMRERAVGRLVGSDRVVIRRDELPGADVVESRPVARAYRALVSEYFRRLGELAE
jgi:hypothetical protein